MKLKFFGIAALLLLMAAGVCISAPAGADDLVDFGNEIEREISWFRNETEQDLQEFRDERDRLFAEFLEEQWKEFEAFAGLIADRTPKPVKIPKASERPDDNVLPAGKKIDPPSPPATPPPLQPSPPSPPKIPPPAPEPFPDLTPTPEPDNDKKPIAPPLEPPSAPPISRPDPEPAPAPSPMPDREPAPPVSPPADKGNDLELEFFGVDLRVKFDPLLKANTPLPPTNQGIAAFWKQASTGDFPQLVNRLLELRKSFQLNDWGYYQLTMAIAERIQPQPHEATLLCWFLLIKSGYQAKVGFNGDRICLIVPAVHTIYGVPYYNLEGSRYYNFSYLKNRQNPGRLFIYKENYPGADHLMGLDLERPPAIRQVATNRTLVFRYAGKKYEIPVTYNPNMIHFLETYPQTDLAVFFNAAVHSDAEHSLLAGLGRLVADKTETEAVNMLLRFVQTAFDYQTDDEQFGYEKYFFAEETVHFPFSDCEDRSVLFSYLVRRLTGLEVIALHYPGHIATAVRFNSTVPGDAVAVGGNRFVVCDPTYINANVGMAMPRFKGVTPEVIKIGI